MNHYLLILARYEDYWTDFKLLGEYGSLEFAYRAVLDHEEPAHRYGHDRDSCSHCLVVTPSGELYGWLALSEQVYIKWLEDIDSLDDIARQKLITVGAIDKQGKTLTYGEKLQNMQEDYEP